MADNVKPRRRRWRVTLYNPLAFRRTQGASLYTDAFRQCTAEASAMGRAFHRALTAGGAEFLAQQGVEGLPIRQGYDFCGTAVNCFEAARAAMVRHPSNATRVAVTDRGFTVEIERVR